MSGKDIAGVVNILENSFGPDDGQRILGERLTGSLFRVLIKLPDSIFLIAEKELKPLGFIWLQVRPLSIARSILFAPFESLLFFFSIISEFKLNKILKSLRGQFDKTSFDNVLPKMVSFAVDKEFRNKGVGKSLLVAAEQQLRKKNKSSYFSVTAGNNSKAIVFYEKNGFKRVKNNEMSLLYEKTIEL